ncbi:MAG: hypothetical protein A2934_01345 [Candidatus Sungbacteria bacterium RIFCSPLOWO2_01_FULL_47_10]|uniref:Uncharacterized protein n=1 Tax=Candidatus Sungbacteria bacterium RIFCSPLOWO2_01_FULL_47_10 TaxID=1802276 RepID=A0A1G2KZ24_9BACT|nr:MAG: hypothetical protein A2934_01345 [Candidatus Sungbacteria bacterium RIFCSPLOWO2_01_FULL_47_10]
MRPENHRTEGGRNMSKTVQGARECSDSLPQDAAERQIFKFFSRRIGREIALTPKDLKHFYVDREGNLIFFHDFCGGFKKPQPSSGQGFRVCTRCKKIFSPFEREREHSLQTIVVVFREGIGEKKARSLLDEFDLRQIEFKTDKKNPNTCAAVATVPSEKDPNYVTEEIEKRSEIVRLASRMPV